MEQTSALLPHIQYVTCLPSIDIDLAGTAGRVIDTIPARQVSIVQFVEGSRLEVPYWGLKLFDAI